MENLLHTIIEKVLDEIRKENFIYSFLSSVRQKMQQSKK